MGNGYTRQSASEIVDTEVIEALDFNAEFNALQAAFNSTTGHSHDGTSGEGPKIGLTTSISGVLPVVHGGIAAIHKIDATTAPTTGDDSGDGYGPGSIWVDVTNDVSYICVDASPGTAVWYRISFQALVAALGGLTPTDGNIIVGNGTTWVAESGATARTSLGVAIGSDVQAFNVSLAAIAGLTPADGAFIVGNGTTFVAESDGDARTSLGLGALAVEDEITTSLIAADTLVTEAEGIGSNDNDTTIPTSAAVKAYADATVGGSGALLAASNLSDLDNASTARDNLGVTIGTDVQAYDADLDTYAANPLTAAELGELQNIGSTTISALQWGYLGSMSAYGATLVDDADAGTARATLGLVISTDVQAYSADLDTYAANPLTAAELGELQNIGSTTITAAQWGYLGGMTAFGASLVDDANAAAARETLEIRSAVLSFGTLVGTTVPDNVTVYLGPRGHSSGTTDVHVITAPFAGVLRNLHVRCDGSPGTGDTFTYTVRVADADTALTATVSNTTAAASNTVTEVSVSAGQRIQVKLATSSGAFSREHNVTLELSQQ